MTNLPPLTSEEIAKIKRQAGLYGCMSCGRYVGGEDVLRLIDTIERVTKERDDNHLNAIGWKGVNDSLRNGETAAKQLLAEAEDYETMQDLTSRIKNQ